MRTAQRRSAGPPLAPSELPGDAGLEVPGQLRKHDHLAEQVREVRPEVALVREVLAGNRDGPRRGSDSSASRRGHRPPASSTRSTTAFGGLRAAWSGSAAPTSRAFPRGVSRPAEPRRPRGFRFVLVDVSGDAWRWVDEEMVWARARRDPDSPSPQGHASPRPCGVRRTSTRPAGRRFVLDCNAITA